MTSKGPWCARCLIAPGAIDRRGCEPLGRREPTETAPRTQTLDDDIDGGPADDPIPFSYHGTQYEIVQSKKEDMLVEGLEPFTRSARRIGSGRRSSTTAPVGQRDKNQFQAMRDWARANGREHGREHEGPRQTVPARPFAVGEGAELDARG